MQIFGTEQQYILDIDLRRVYEVYSSLRRKILIPRKIFFATDVPMSEDDRRVLQKEIEAGYFIMYTCGNIQVVDFKTTRGTIDKRVDPVELSAMFSTTVIDYSNWEEQRVIIANRGKTALSLFSVGPNLENVFKIIKVDLRSVCRPDINKIKEAVTYDVLAKW